MILAIAHGIGESAPLLIVSGFTTFYNSNPLDAQPMNSLPLYIYEGIRSGEPHQIARAFGAAVVLLAMVFVLFAITGSSPPEGWPPLKSLPQGQGSRHP